MTALIERTASPATPEWWARYGREPRHCTRTLIRGRCILVRTRAPALVDAAPSASAAGASASAGLADPRSAADGYQYRLKQRKARNSNAVAEPSGTFSCNAGRVNDGRTAIPCRARLPRECAAHDARSKATPSIMNSYGPLTGSGRSGSVAQTGRPATRWASSPPLARRWPFQIHPGSTRSACPNAGRPQHCEGSATR